LSCRAVFLFGVLGASALASSGHASDAPPPPRSFSRELVSEMRRLIDAAMVARPPKLIPPKPIEIKWKLGKLATLELGAPLVALAGGDLDGDGKGELYALTTREVIAFAADGNKLRERGRIAFSGERASIAPRDIVGTLTLGETGTSLVASLSPWARSLRIASKSGVLTSEPGAAGFEVCPGEVLQLAPGRNYFGDARNGTYGARCGRGLVDNDGYPLRARAVLSLASKLDVTVERCAAPGLACQLAARHEVAGAGTAFEIADLDRNGTLELLYASAVPVGELDAFRVVSLGGDDKQPRLKRSFAGGVAAIALADLGGKGVRQAVVATRVGGTTKIELWRIE
jgi:hypothetical protein